MLPTPEVQPLLQAEANKQQQQQLAPSLPCSVWGPTCDGIDCVIADAKLPSSLPVGGWLYFPDMGAYTSCAGSNFNGMALPDVAYLQARGDHAKPQAPHKAAAAMLQQLRKEGVTAMPKSSKA